MYREKVASSPGGSDALLLTAAGTAPDQPAPPRNLGDLMISTVKRRKGSERLNKLQVREAGGGCRRPGGSGKFPRADTKRE